VLKRLDLRIDQDDRIALLGANGQGKSTLSKLLAERLRPMTGRRVASSKLRIGYFAQHQVDELELQETPIDHIRRLRPNETPAKIRARLAGGGIGAAIADTRVGQLSGGQKARLSLLIATLDAPHMIILDEPTNHLDIESREALVQALNAYDGAVILVSHDPHLIGCVADRLWLVKDGAVQPWEDDLDAYQRLLLGQKQPTDKKAPHKAKRPPQNLIKTLRAEVEKCEARIQKLEDMRRTIDSRLANPLLYERGDTEEIAKWQKKRGEVEDGLTRAEGLWAEAQDKLDRAEGNT
ncbi:MAG: ATP-binding cassette domain-containing protein, partial [Pseudomonadota bacterium]